MNTQSAHEDSEGPIQKTPTRETLFRMEAFQSRVRGEVLLINPVSYWAISALLAAALTGLCVWSSFMPYMRVIGARGILVPQGGLAAIYPKIPGVVTEVKVKDGQLVTTGTPLVTIDPQTTTEGGQRPGTLQLEALKDQQKYAEEKLAVEQHRDEAMTAGITDRLRSMEAQHDNINQEIDLQKTLVESSNRRLELYSSVVSTGAISKLDFEQFKESTIEREQKLLSLQHDLADSTLRQADLRAQLKDSLAESSARVADIKATLRRLDQERASMYNGVSYILTAPMSGRITTLQATKGLYTDGRFPLMTVVSEDGRLMAELYVPSRTVGFAQVGQSVRIYYDDFAHERYGAAYGVVEDVSKAALIPNEVLAPITLGEPVFRLRVRITTTPSTPQGALPLMAGMTLTGTVILERTTVLRWAISALAGERE